MNRRKPSDAGPASQRKSQFGWRWWLWSALLILWTVGLLLPESGTRPIAFGDISHTKRLYIAKTVHVFVYLLLTILASHQHFALRGRLWLLAALMIHAPLSELLQLFVANRSGRFLDVGLDYAGVAIGMIVTWRMWRSGVGR